MKPILYKADETDFNHNGLGILAETISCEVTEERNGEFELYMEYPVSGLHYAEIQDLCLIKAKPNSVDDPHVFTIYERNLDTVSQMVSINATSISNLLGGNLVATLSLTDVTPQTALDALKSDLVEPTDFMFYSDINTTNDIAWTMRNPLNCIAGEEGSLLDVFGGEVKRGNSFIWLYARRGRDNVTTIRHGKNLSGLEVEYSTKGLVTKILPYFTLTPEGSDIEEMISGDLVVSQYAANYPASNILAVDYSRDDRVTDLASLNSVAGNYFTENTGIDRPSLTMDVELDDLSDSSEYTQFKDLENIELCDTVTVYAKRFDVNIVAKVTKIVYDVLREKNQTLNVGSIRTSFYDDVKGGYKDLVRDVTATLNNTIEKAANGKNRVFRGVDEPLTGMVKNDVWYKPVGAGEIEMYVYDGAYWQKEAYSADSLGGTANFANINAINLNLNALTTASISGANMWLNLITGTMEFTNPITGDILVLDQGEIYYKNGTNTRHLRYSNEGFIFEPGSGNTGTALNTSLILKGGFGSHKYIDFIDQDDTTGLNRGRLVAVGDLIRMHVGGGGVEIRDNASLDDTDELAPIKASYFVTGGTNPTHLYEDRWETPRDGSRSLVISPNGTGKLMVATPDLGAYYPIWASDFVVVSSEVFKTNIEPMSELAMPKVKTLEVVEYDLITDEGTVDPEREKQVGFIAENSPQIATPDGRAINLYKTIALNVQAVQELEAELASTKQELADLKTLLKTKGVI